MFSVPFYTETRTLLSLQDRSSSFFRFLHSVPSRRTPTYILLTTKSTTHNDNLQNSLGLEQNSFQWRPCQWGVVKSLVTYCVFLEIIYLKGSNIVFPSLQQWSRELKYIGDYI